MKNHYFLLLSFFIFTTHALEDTFHQDIGFWIPCPSYDAGKTKKVTFWNLLDQKKYKKTGQEIKRLLLFSIFVAEHEPITQSTNHNFLKNSFTSIQWYKDPIRVFWVSKLLLELMKIEISMLPYKVFKKSTAQVQHEVLTTLSIFLGEFNASSQNSYAKKVLLYSALQPAKVFELFNRDDLLLNKDSASMYISNCINLDKLLIKCKDQNLPSEYNDQFNYFMYNLINEHSIQILAKKLNTKQEPSLYFEKLTFFKAIEIRPYKSAH